ncbi:GNAT family N-acetyltransferase [Paenibacillus glacialis]|uniref:Acyl-CoA thioesterase n=1 Tax=Paenibacillus glacialis TaxID=494026 RepID=A0A168N1S7_9BACL|nr:GNAT family N-acetyltransferase [Paenibacillus glacialis]OAB45295.1 acyl-CoA thioesterase [Paenibacillus glacialis]
MITELNKQDFYTIKHLTDPCNNIEVRAVVNGNNPGWVYIDHPTEPTAALVWIQGQEGFHIIGDAQSGHFRTGLEAYMTQHIEPRLQKLGVNWVEISGETDSWAETIQEIFNSRDISSDIQHVFTLKRNIDTSEFIEDKIMIRRLDENILNSMRLENHTFLEEKINRYWDSTDAFLQLGFGYMVEHNNNVVSLCFSAFVDNETHAIDIETLEGYKRNKYGTAVARAVMEECKQRGISPYWDCSPDNTGSITVAKSLGMTPYFDYRIFWYEFK